MKNRQTGDALRKQVAIHDDVPVLILSKSEYPTANVQQLVQIECNEISIQYTEDTAKQPISTP